MADAAVKKLRDAFANAPAGKVKIDAALFTDAGLTAPEGFDAAITAAYRLTGTAALEVEYDRSAVTPVGDDDSFSIPDVTLQFLQAPQATTSAAIYGQKGGATTPKLGIDVEPGGWQLADQFPAMDPKSWPFVLLSIAQQRFFFASEPIDWVWSDTGDTLSFPAGQNLYGMLSVPQEARPLFEVVTGLPTVPPSLQLNGPIVLDKVDNETVLYPDMDLRAGIAGGTDLQIFFIHVVDPHLGMRIASATETLDPDGHTLLALDGTPEEVVVQSPFFYFGTTIALEAQDGSTLPFALQAGVDRTMANYQFSIGPSDEDKPITPAAIITLMSGGESASYFDLLPPVLQQYLAAIQLKGVSVRGPLKPTLGLGSLSAVLGSVNGVPIPLGFSDPTSGAPFSLESFELLWQLNKVAKGYTSYGMVSGSFKLFPEIFRTKAGDPGGLFSVSIDTDLNFEGSFGGTASMEDVLRGVTGGAVGMPEGVEVSFSDISVSVRPSEKAYALGFSVDASLSVPFITGPEGAPLIEIADMGFQLGARTPKSDGAAAKTVYTASIDGGVTVGPVVAKVKIDYDGEPVPPVWSLNAGLAKPLPLSQLVNQFLADYDLPEFLPDDLTVERFDISATIPSGGAGKLATGRALTRAPRLSGAAPRDHSWRSTPGPARHRRLRLATASALPGDASKSSYDVSGAMRWIYSVTEDFSIDTLAELGLSYDGNRSEGQQYAGSVIGTVTIEAIGVEVQVGYRFGPAKNDVAQIRMPMPDDMLEAAALGQTSRVLWLAWQGFRAEYDAEAKTITFSMTGWTVGGLITALVEIMGDPYFTLPSPWSLLNQISLNGLEIVFYVGPDKTRSKISAVYNLPSPINMGFMSIEGLTFQQVDGKTTLAIKGEVSVPGLKGSPLFDPSGKGQDVKDMPKVPGRGNAYFNLNLLALGQRVAISGAGEFKTTQAVIKAMEDIPASDGDKLPFDPKTQKSGQPYYDPTSGWLAAMHFGVLRVGETNVYAVDLMIAFSDPKLAGLRLALNGDKMKVLAGLAIDILYERVTDDVGRYSLEFTLPSVLRNLNFGAVAITLPTIGIEIYTNGDFKFDFGFPANMDFSRSFMLQAQIGPVPVLGAGGFYFGKLSNATAPGLPATDLGTFEPVIVFGFGMQLGVGRKIDYGILKAGISITVFGIIEGTIAAWHPYDNLPANPNEVQGDYYFKISGTFGIIGEVYGSVDFVIIKADVKLRVVIYVQIAYESFRKIPMVLAAQVQVSVSVKIDLWLFSITISFSFSATIKVELTVGQDSLAPWDPPQRSLADMSALHDVVTLDFGPDGALVSRRGPRVPRTLYEYGLHRKRFAVEPVRAHAAFAAAERTPIEITAMVQTTVLGAEGSDYAQQEGGLVLLFAIDAPVAKSEGPVDPGGNTSFGKLSAAFLPWIIASVVPPEGIAAAGSVTRPHLEAILQALSDSTKAPFTAEDLTTFLSGQFTITVSAAHATTAAARKAALERGAAIFPALDFLSMTVPKPDGEGTVTVDFSNYATATAKYEQTIRDIFAETAANVGEETGKAPNPRADADTPKPLASSIYADYFILLARQLVQAGIDRFDDYPYPLTDTTKLTDILGWANGALPDQLDAASLMAANLTYPLVAGKTLTFADVGYMVQKDDTAASVAARYTLEPARIITGNQKQSSLIAAGVTVTFPGAAKSYVTRAGDSFDSLAKAFDVTIDTLAADPGIQGMKGLLAPGVVLTVPEVTRTTQDGDTVAKLIAALNVPIQSFLTAQNLDAPGLFQIAPDLHFAVPKLVAMPQEALWPAILSAGGLGQIAGMASRYMMHGMRLPMGEGLTLPGDFLYGAPHWDKVQSGYGLYQLTGQQVPLAVSPGSYPITLSQAEARDWFLLGSDGKSLGFDIAPQTDGLTKVVETARSAGFAPALPLLEAHPGTALEPRKYGVANYVSWMTSGLAQLRAVTAPPAAQAEAGGPQAKPCLFELSGTLTAALVEAQAALSGHLPDFAALAPYLPVLEARLGTTDPATSRTHYAPIEDYCLATRIDFRIKQLAQSADPAPESPFGNDVTPPDESNPGSPAQALAPFAYEIVGPNPGQSVLLERLLTAMASSGEDMVSGIFLTWLDVNSGAKGLTSRGPDEFLSYIVQSNLSTETHPPRDAARLALLASQPATGIANTPAEFIKLLWELSTVNAGGTYLFYQLLEDGTGLPPALFDESGQAELTLVVTLRRDRATGQRAMNAVNALVTTSPVDPATSDVVLEGVSAPFESQPTAPDATPGEIAEAYGLDLAQLALTNGAAPLRPGAAVPLSGLIYQVTMADIATGKSAAEIVAERFSAGAETPLHAADVAAHNPGVADAALTVWRVPDFTYLVQADGPGATLSAMADYYGTGVPELGFSAAATKGFFAGPTVTIDPVALTARQLQGNGNASITLERERPAPLEPLPSDPTPADWQAYTTATLNQLYQMIAGRIDATPFFDASAEGASVGPVDKTRGDAGNAPEPRRAMFLAVTPENPLLYELGFGYTEKALVNPIAVPEAPGPLPDPALNPYRGVGTPVQLALDWLDLFGNHIPNPFNHPAATTNPAGALPVPLYYTDRLIALDAWPSTRRSYRYTGAAGAPVLELTLAFDTAAYEPETGPETAHLAEPPQGSDLPLWQRNAQADRAKWNEIYYQLTQDYTDAKVPGLTGPAVSMSLVNSLLSEPEQPLGDENRARVLDFVCAAVGYLAQRAEGGTPKAPEPVMLSVDVAPADVDPTQDILQISLALRLSRLPGLVDPGLRAVRGGISASSTIPVDGLLTPSQQDATEADLPKYPVALTEFAKAFEIAFVTDQWGLRVGSGAPDPAASGTSRSRKLWAVRMAKPGGKGIAYAIENKPVYYAPEPIASQLQTLDATIEVYETGSPYPSGETKSVTFTNIDPNIWLAEYLTAIDTALTATLATPLFQLDRLLGLSETDDTGVPLDKTGYLTRLLRAKERLAATVSSTALSVLQGASDALRGAAVEKMEQALLDQLSNANTLTAVAVLPVSGAGYSPVLPKGVTAPRLYGQPTVTPGKSQQVAGPAENRNFALSSGKIPLQEGGKGSHLAFVISSRAGETRPYVELPLDYAMTHIEFDIHAVPGIDKYEQSRWITLVTGAVESIVAPEAAPLSVPVALRALPTPATVVTQTGERAEGGPKGPASLRRWTYGFSYLLNRAPQDSVFAEVVFNLHSSESMIRSKASPLQTALYDALAQFVAIYPAVEQDLETYLRPINAKTEAASPDVATARDAVDALTLTVEAVAKAYADWAAGDRTLVETGAPPPTVEYNFEMVLRAGEGDIAELEIVPQSFVVDGAETPYFLPVAEVLIAPEDYEPEPRDSDPKTGAVTWVYAKKGSDPKTYLSYEDANSNAARTVRFDGLDLFALQNGWSSLVVARNRHLSPDAGVKTTSAFEFATAASRFADPLVPLISVPDYALGTSGAAQPVSDWLTPFFTELLTPDAGMPAQPVLVKIETLYTYMLVPGASPGSVPQTVLPVNLLAPSSTEAQPDPPLVAEVSAAAQDWFDTTRPVVNASAGLVFGLTVFSASGESNLPLLSIGALTLPSQKIETS